MDNQKNGNGDTKWNNEQSERLDHSNYNEGFSTENISDDYNPAEEDIKNRLTPETEVDKDGNAVNVERARYVEKETREDAATDNPSADNRKIENPQSLQNRDRNYDTDPNRYPADDPENKTSRGNISFGE